MALPKQQRIKKRKDFDAIFKKGRGYQGKFFAVKILDNGFSFCRVAVIISSNLTPSAVSRNNGKRKILAVMTRLFTFCKVPVDIVVIVKQDIKEKKSKDIQQSLFEIFKKANIV